MISVTHIFFYFILWHFVYLPVFFYILQKIRNDMICSIKVRIRKAGGKDKQEKETMMDDDMLTIALLSLKACQNSMIALIAFNAILIQVAGRGSETALCTFSDLNTLPYENDYQKSSILFLDFRRDKTAHTQKPRIFPQADTNHWYKDVYFMMGILLIIRCAGAFNKQEITKESSLFPLFYEQAQMQERQSGEKGKGTSYVSNFYGSLFKEIVQFFKDHSKEDPDFSDTHPLNFGIASHSPKRGASQSLGESCSNVFAALYRMGYLMQAVS